MNVFSMKLSRKRLRHAFIMIGISALVLVAARILLPLGDEPDFNTSTQRVLYKEYGMFSPFHYFQQLYLEHSSLITQATLWSTVYRLALTLTISLPLYMYVIGASAERPSTPGTATRQDYIGLSLLMPSVWFHLGILGEESLILCILLLTFCTDSRLIKLLFFALAVAVDLGDSIVFAYYWVMYRLFLSAFSRHGLKMAWFLLLVTTIVSYVFSMSLLELLTWIPVVGEYASTIFDAYTNIYTEVNNKYPLFFRPIMTFLGLVFMLPESQMMVLPAYPIAFAFACTMVVRLSSRYKEHPEAVASIYAGLAIIVSMPMILPGFSNAKYYVFIIPAVLRGFLLVFRKRDVMLWIFIINVLVFATLLWNYSDAQELSL